MKDAITDVTGIKVGHAQDTLAGTGCTVILCEKGAVTGVDVRGGAPSTRETDLLSPMNIVPQAHAVFLSGGSAFGLPSAAGVMKYLEERGIGFDVGVTKIPIVPGAAIFDLTVGNHTVRPTSTMAYNACEQATQGINDQRVNDQGINNQRINNQRINNQRINNQRINNQGIYSQGNIGAGTGATVGKIAGMEYAMKGGLGSASIKSGELVVGALVVVNCLGDVVDPITGKIIAGSLMENKRGFRNTMRVLKQGSEDSRLSIFSSSISENTTIGVIATNACLNKADAMRVAMMTHDGYARTIKPAHTMYDGDTVFCMSTGDVQCDLSKIGALAADVMAQAVINAIQKAESSYGFIAWKDLPDESR